MAQTPAATARLTTMPTRMVGQSLHQELCCGILEIPDRQHGENRDSDASRDTRSSNMWGEENDLILPSTSSEAPRDKAPEW